jgi:hypothetical protein
LKKGRSPTTQNPGSVHSGNNQNGVLIIFSRIDCSDGNGPGSSKVTDSSLTDGRETIYFSEAEIDFVTLHNVLYYIYTGLANLGSTYSFLDLGLPRGFPQKADLFGLAQIAQKFRLVELEKDCGNELRSGTTVNNVAGRLLHPVCKDNQELREFYLDYLLKNYDKVKNTEGWEQAVIGEDNESSDMRRYRTLLVIDITKRIKG